MTTSTFAAPVLLRQLLGNTPSMLDYGECPDLSDSATLDFALNGTSSPIAFWLNHYTPFEYDISRPLPEHNEHASLQSGPLAVSLFQDDNQATRDFSTRQPVPDESASHSAPINFGVARPSNHIFTVNNPRHEYPLEPFLQHWISMEPASATARQSTQVSVPLSDVLSVLRTPSITVIDESCQRDCDWQGLAWKRLGRSRAAALDARIRLRPYLKPFVQSPHPANPRRSLRADGARTYQFRSFVTRHRPRFEHYQLRNVVTAASRNEIFYSTGDTVVQASSACPTWSQTVMDFSQSADQTRPFKITCLASTSRHSHPASDHALIAGGFHGDFAFLALDSPAPTTHTSHLTHADNGIITHIHTALSRHSGLLQAIFCSNDTNLYTLDLHTATILTRHTHPTALNSSSTSPDQRLRLIAGDSPVAVIADADRGDIVATLPSPSNLVSTTDGTSSAGGTGHTDHIFATAWSPSGTYLATGSQDGTTLIYDARRLDAPVCVRQALVSCPRTLDFDDGGALVVGEEEDVVSTYGGGSGSGLFELTQELRFFGSVAGVGMVDGGKEMVVGLADEGVGGLMRFGRERVERRSVRGSWGRARGRDLAFE